MTATLDDLHELALVIGDAFDTNDGDIGQRLKEHVETTIRVREAQKTRSRTAAHAEMVEAFRAALNQWHCDRELATNGYVAEMIEWRKTHPRPMFADFMRASARPADICPTCGRSLRDV